MKMVTSYLAIMLFFLILGSTAEASSSIELIDSVESIELNSEIEILEDQNNEWDIEKIMSGDLDNEFIKNDGDVPSYGYSSTIYWVRFQVINHSDHNNWFLELDNPTMDVVTLYDPYSSDEEIKERETGDLYPFAQREIDNRNFIFQIGELTDEVQVYYLRFETEGAMQLPLTIRNQEALIAKTQIDYVIIGLLCGLAIVMAIYNLFIYFSLRHFSYLFYVLFILVNLFTYLSFTGVAYQFFWPEAVWWNNRAIIFFMCGGNILALLFTNSFLDMKKRLSRPAHWLQLIIGLNVAILIILLFSYSVALNLIVVASITSVVFIISVAFKSIKQGFRPARYFFAAWHIFVIGVVVSILTDTGAIPLTFITKYAWQITTSVELVLLSFALADKINTMRYEKEKAEQELIESQQKILENLKKTDKLKDEFLTVTSHELKTPLNGIIGIAESMYDGASGKLDDLLKYNLSMIIVSGKRLNHLVNDILDFSKLNNNDMELKLKKVHVKEVTDVVVTICQTLVKGKDIKVINKVNQHLPPVLADENRLQQILYNLIGNGIKYTKNGEITIRAVQKDQYLKVYVQDTGIGIPKKYIETIFLPFYRGRYKSEQEDGTGIGLNVTKRLVELQNGQVLVESEVGKGSTFMFTLPLFNESVSTSEVINPEELFLNESISTSFFSSRKPHTSSEKKATILVADDDPVNQQVLINYLSLEGYQVDTTSDGDEALELIEEGRTYDLVMLDVMMPKISGYKVCQRLREKYSLSELPVLMLTAKNQVEDRITAFEVGANDYLAKPSDKRELLSRTKTLIRLKQADKEIKDRAEELKNINIKLKNLNNDLEDKVDARTKELAERNEQLIESNQELIDMEKGRVHLLSNISHELGTPITFLQGYVQTVKEGYIDAGNLKYLNIVENKVKLLDRLINDLFDLVKFESGKMRLNIENIELEPWLLDVYNRFELEVNQSNINLIKTNVNYLHRVDTTILLIDIERMDQVFSNLISNAIKHTSSGGVITISAEVSKNKRNNKTFEFDGMVVIEVKDNGIGIDQSTLPHIFERFYKGSNYSGDSGTGLGLAITKEIIEYHKGEIWVESSAETGTSFFVSLPVVFKDSVKNEGV
ncbi:ATP-binding protein [Salipaludibacillus sp. HK11]|uniref:ATP-binding protein n=1 Tax=Salipaludibacillus sp. HK11 TaxID=3394320 RepID=UPI0039FCA982